MNKSNAGIVAPAIAIAVQNGNFQSIGPRNPDIRGAIAEGPNVVDYYDLLILCKIICREL